MTTQTSIKLIFKKMMVLSISKNSKETSNFWDTFHIN